MKELKERQYDINLQTEDHTKADESYYITASRMLDLAKRAKSLFESSEIPEKRAILNFLLQNFVVNGKKPAFDLRTPFNHILELSTSMSLLPILDTFRTLNWLQIKNDFEFSGILRLTASTTLI